MDEQSKQFIEESNAVEREEHERLRAERAARAEKKSGKNAKPAPESIRAVPVSQSD